MGKYLSVVGGAVSIILGLRGLGAWWGLFVKGLQATVPAFLILAGIIAVIAGISEIKDSLAAKKPSK